MNVGYLDVTATIISCQPLTLHLCPAQELQQIRMSALFFLESLSAFRNVTVK